MEKKNKKKKINKKACVILAITLLVIVLVVVLCIVLCNKDDKKKDPKAPASETVKLNNIETDGYVISNIVLKTNDNESILSFNIKNNTEVTREDGMMSFTLKDSKDAKVTETSTYITAIESKEEVEVEIILNEPFTDIKTVTVNK